MGGVGDALGLHHPSSHRAAKGEAGARVAAFKTIRIVSGKVRDVPISLRDGTPAAIDRIILSLFTVRGLDTIRFVSSGPDRVRILYTGDESLDEAIRGQFQWLRDRRGAAAMALETEQVAPIQPIRRPANAARWCRKAAARRLALERGVPRTAIP